MPQRQAESVRETAPPSGEVLRAEDMARMASVLRHRLRNHVTGIQSAVSLLADELQGHVPQRILEYFPLIRWECELIKGLVERLDAFLAPLPEAPPQAIEDVLRLACSACRQEFPSVPVELAIEKEAAERHVPHGARIVTGLKELLRNAAESRGGQSRARLHCHPLKGTETLEITVSDTGPGVPEDSPARQFLPFYTTKSKHLGLGLAIANRMIRACGGSLDFDPPQHAAGLCVRVRLPVRTTSPLKTVA